MKVYELWSSAEGTFSVLFPFRGLAYRALKKIEIDAKKNQQTVRWLSKDTIVVKTSDSGKKVFYFVSERKLRFTWSPTLLDPPN